MTTAEHSRAERTFVFTDIEGSTERGLKLSPAEYARVVEEHKARLLACFARHGGDVEKNPGDGFFVAFPNVSDALACAVAIQQDLRGDTSAPIQAEIGGRAWTVQVRIGVYKAAGEVHRQPNGAFTDTEVNLANRFMSCGAGGQILVNAAAYSAIERHELPYKWQVWDNRYIRDIDGPQTLHELLWDETSREIKAPLWAPNWLLRETNAFVGRKAYLDNIKEWLQSDRPLLVLHGEGGVGKTRLVSQAVREFGSRFEGRIYGVALDREFSGDPASVTALQLASRIGESLDAPQDVLSSETPDALSRYMTKRFGRETCWMILDNFESVHNEQTLELIGDLLYAVPNLRCVVTCRVLVELVGETIGVHVQGMATPHDTTDALDTLDSAKLFRTRANQYDPLPDLSDTPSLVRILNATEGNSLAIELVAAHCKNPRLTLKDIADGLEASRLKWLRPTPGSVRYGASRHKSLEACIDWSYQLLPPNEQELYPRLSVFPADFDPHAAETIADIPTDILDHWIMFHLVQVEDRSKRCILQPVLREFAANHLSEEQKESLYICFAAYYAELAYQNNTFNNIVQRKTINAELRNLHAAAQYLCVQVSQVDMSAANLYALGYVLLNVPRGSRQEDLQQAIACFEALLRVCSEANSPYQWASAKACQGKAYSNLATGDRSTNLLRTIDYYNAALRVLTETNYPREWAMLQNSLGIVYHSLPTGEREANLQQAVTCYTAALRIRTEADLPQDWAETQNNLGNVYSEFSTGDRSANLLRTIDYYNAALRVLTEINFPLMWAMLQNNLGEAYRRLPADERKVNLQHAIVCYTAALRVLTEADFPLDWAIIQNNMSIVYTHLAHEEQVYTEEQEVNLQQAIACCMAALRFRTEAEFPYYWAGTQANLGNAYRILATGERNANLQYAIKCFEAAHRVYTEADFPKEWAGIQYCLALAYADLDNKANAQQAMQNAGRGYRAIGMAQEAQKAEAYLQRTDWP